MEDMKVKAQQFMNTNGITKCYECDGQLYKHEHNAAGRKQMTGGEKEIITHELNAGKSTNQNKEA